MNSDRPPVDAHASVDPQRLPEESAEPSSVSALYRAVWRWHFYAGLVCLPFLFTMAVTGALYLFRVEIESVVYRDLLFVGAGSAPLVSPQSIVDAALRDQQPGNVARYVPPAAPGRSAEVGVVRSDGVSVSVYVDPHGAQVLGHVRDDRKLMQVIKGLHSLAIAGTVANHWIEIVAGWAIVLTITGTYLWWPRGRSGGVVTVRGQPARRVWWRDLHAVTGVTAAVAVLFLAVTGMPWSAFWGEQFGHLTNAWGIGLPEYAWGKTPQSSLPMASQGEVPWTLRQAAVPQSGSPGSTDLHAAHHGSITAQATGAILGTIGLDAAIRTFEQLGLKPGYSVTLPAGERGVYTAMLFPDDATQERVIHLDQYSGKPLVDIGYADYGIAGKAIEWGVSLHTGRQFGLINQFVMLFGCLAIVVLAISSVVMWWKRRPRGRLAAPARQDADRLARTVIAIAIALGLFYPLLGASMVAALAIDAAIPRAWRARYGL